MYHPMKLYQDKYAPNPRRVRVFLAEKGVDDVELETVEIAKKQNRSDNFLRMNPLGQVPVLELSDGRLLCESMAICRYFEALFPEPALFGTEPFELATIEQWNRRAELEFLYSIGETFRHTHAFWNGRIDQIPEYGELSRARAMRAMTWFDQELATREYVAGDSFSVADITAFCAIDFGRICQIRVSDDHENLTRWYAAMKQRPSAGA